MSSSPTSILSGSLAAGAKDEPDEMPPLSLNDSTRTSSSGSPFSSSSTSWKTPLPVSQKALRTINPIRAIVDPIVANIQSGQERGDGKDFISLALGDPTAAGNLPPCPVALQAIAQTVATSNHGTTNTAGGHHHAAGYVSATGTLPARQAIAQFHTSMACASSVVSSSSSSSSSHVVVDPSDVIVANGCSGALELALTALLDTDSILLVPQPGFPLYQVIAQSHGATVVPYRLDPDSAWQCDLGHLHTILQHYPRQRIRALLINNPSNPTGAVFTKQHLQQIVQFCQHHHLPLVADEVYGDLTFAGHTFYPAAAVAAELGRHVPVITASGLGKQFLVPGWRVGWIVFQDNVHGSLRQVEDGAKRLAQVILGASHLAQTAIPALLDPSNPMIFEWKKQLRQTLQVQAAFLCRQLTTALSPTGAGGQHQQLQVLQPGGAMYAMVRIDTDQFDETVQSDLDFSKRLLAEENVFVLPGSCFGIQNVFRVVFCAPVPILGEAAKRIGQFCERHRKKNK